MDRDEVLDSSDSLSLDGSSLSNVEHVVTYTTTNNYTGQTTDLTFQFSTAVPVESGCFVKLQVPIELSMVLFDVTVDVTSTGMLVGQDGKPSKQVYDYNAEEQYIVVQGCQFDPADGESSDYQKDVFIITVHNLINPPSDDETVPVSIIVSKSWDNGPL